MGWSLLKEQGCDFLDLLTELTFPAESLCGRDNDFSCYSFINTARLRLGEARYARCTASIRAWRRRCCEESCNCVREPVSFADPKVILSCANRSVTRATA